MKTAAIAGSILAALLVLGILAAALPGIEAALTNRFFAREIATEADLPWAAPGRKARYYALKSWDWNKGVTGVKAWGSGARRKEDPIETAYRAFAFLEKHRAMDAWPEAGSFETYSVHDRPRPDVPHRQDSYGNTLATYARRVAPYRFFLVAIEPTVILMQSAPELPGWWDEHVRQGYPRNSRWARWVDSLPEQQQVPYLIWLLNPVGFGTELPRGSGWQWFSPDLEQLPTGLPLAENGGATIPLKQGRLRFQPGEPGWRVVRE